MAAFPIEGPVPLYDEALVDPEEWDAPWYQAGNLHCAQDALNQIASNAFDYAQSEVQPTILPDECCDRQTPFHLAQIQKDQFIGCPTTFVKRPVKMYKKNPKIWRANLDSSLYERSIASGALPNPYDPRHWNRRQRLVQSLTRDWRSRKDPYMRPIHSFEDAYAARINKIGDQDACSPADAVVGRVGPDAPQLGAPCSRAAPPQC